MGNTGTLQDTTVTAASYTEILKSKLKPVICNKRRGFVSQVVLLPHSNTCPHSTAAAIGAVRQLRFELL
jgi:hypothetical protein